MSNLQFERIAVIDDLDIPVDRQNRIALLSRAGVEFPTDDPDEQQALERVRDADAVLVSWRGVVGEHMLDACPNLRFVAMAASAYANPDECPVDLHAARDREIVVSTLGQYGDEATAEWIIGMLIGAAAHFGPLKWKPERCELFGKTLAVVGMGHVGRQVSARALGLGMNVVYWSRNRKSDMEERGCVYRGFHEALGEADVVSVHVGKGVQLFGRDEFAQIREGTLFVNTSNGPLSEQQSFEEWLRCGRNSVLYDRDASSSLPSGTEKLAHVFVSSQSAGSSYEMKQRKGDQLYENLRSFLGGKPIRIAPV